MLLGFAENQIIIWDFKIQNSVQVTEGSDNGDSDNRSSTVHTKTSFSTPYASGPGIQGAHAPPDLDVGALNFLIV